MPTGFICRRVALVASLVLCGLLICVYLAQWQALAALTVIPAWCWSMLLVVPVALSSRRRLAATVWLAFSLLCIDEWRGLVPFRAGSAEGLTVVVLNCMGSRAAIDEALEIQADVVLLSELPPRYELPPGFSGQLGPDAGLLVRGQVEQAHRGPHWVSARAQCRGRALEVVSTRLVVAVLRADLWNPECWRDQAFNRATRCQQINDLTKVLPATGPVLVGGDFNSPARDGANDSLFACGLSDVWLRRGLGWGNTLENSLPVLRVDRLYQRELVSQRMEVRKTRHSDHRMLVAWFK
ncbi:endonuclease/exonuclease/phosphatase family protein [bacterium]|nr:endonuclease/exonuclease/phosphatase family protein [bacterium]